MSKTETKRHPEPPKDILGREQRLISVSDLELRTGDDDDKSTFVGHAAVFDRWANIGGWFQERIAPGAFKKTIKEADVRMLFNHDPNLVLARNKAGTLTLKEDAIGLYTEAELDRRQTYANDLAIAMERGDVDQMSFAFRVIREEWEDPDGDGKEIPKRTIMEAQLYDVSPVTYPAYAETDAALRSAAFDTLAQGLNLDEDARKKLLEQVARGEQPDLTDLRAADEAPVSENTDEPVTHSEVDPEAMARKHKFLAAKYGL